MEYIPNILWIANQMKRDSASLFYKSSAYYSKTGRPDIEKYFKSIQFLWTLGLILQEDFLYATATELFIILYNMFKYYCLFVNALNALYF